MAISQDLLDILVCPLCKAPVRLVAVGQGLKCGQCKRVYPVKDNISVCPACKAPVQPVAEGQGLKCEQCRRVYPIRDDIPIMLVDEAKIEVE